MKGLKQNGGCDAGLKGLRVAALFICAATLASCASKKKEADYASLKFEQRIGRQLKALQKGGESSIKSPFQQQVYNASRTVKTSEFKSGAFRSKRKGFFGSKDKFKAGTFAQADKTSTTGNKVFSGADNQSRFGRGTFKTSQNPYDGQMSSSSGKTSPMADDVFSTAGNSAVLKNTSNVKTPMIDRAPSYSEEEVRSLLKKN